MTTLSVTQLDTFVAPSFARTRKYHVPSASAVEWVNGPLFAVPAVTPVPKVLSCDHCTVYAGDASPLPLSFAAVHVQVGVWVFVGEEVDGVPGEIGPVVSTTTLEPVEYDD